MGGSWDGGRGGVWCKVVCHVGHDMHGLCSVMISFTCGKPLGWERVGGALLGISHVHVLQESML